jgi:hypothetical protein
VCSATPLEQIRRIITKPGDTIFSGEVSREELDEITGAIVDASMKIDRALGPGLLESVYEPVLAKAFANRGLTVERQKVIRFEYDGIIFEEGLRVDLLVEHDRYRQTAVLRLTGSSSPSTVAHVPSSSKTSGWIAHQLWCRHIERRSPPYRKQSASRRASA